MADLLTRLNNPILEGVLGGLPTDQPIYLVGGAVRDALLSRQSFDLDFVTGGDALKIARKLADELGGAYFPLDSDRNVARIILHPVDVKSTHREKTYKVDISRYQGYDLTGDLQARDFTINAMALDAHHPEKLMDPLHGADDLIARRLRTCSPGSMLADPVRVLRGVRFSMDLELKILPDTLACMREAIPHLEEISAERVRDELFRMLVLPHPSSALRLLDMLGALEHVLPEVCRLKDVGQGPPHVMGAWDHTLDSLTRLESLLEALAPNYDPEKASNLSLGLVVLRLGRFRQQISEHLENALNPERPHRGLLFLAGLYHDVGKESTRSVDSQGTIRFLGHDQLGSRIAENRGQALKLSNLEVERLATIVGHHMRPSLLSHPPAAPTMKAIYRFFRDTGAAGVDVCLLSMADVLATYGPSLPQERWSRHLDVVRSLLAAWWEERTERVLPPAIVNGDDLLAELKLSPGPLIGYLLESIREAQVSGDVHTREDAIRYAREIQSDDLKAQRA